MHNLIILFVLLACTKSDVLEKNLTQAPVVATYYVSPSGNNSNDGLSPATAWQTIAKVNSIDFDLGDVVRLEGGSTFSEVVTITQEDAGLTINSYGTGRAEVAGVTTTNAENITIKGIDIEGTGENGLLADITRTDIDVSGLLIDDVLVKGVFNHGIHITAGNTYNGYRGAKIINSSVLSGLRTGIYVEGYYEAGNNRLRLNHKNISVINCIARNILGDASYTGNWSGSGIIISGTIGGLIDRCTTNDNGINNGSSFNGPVGQWCYEAKYITIQYGVSYNNKGGASAKDGGGFDIDGGSEGCVIQYCYSYNNEGAGFGLYEFGASNAFGSNILRYNVSQNDGINTGYAAVTMYGSDGSHKIRNTEIYNNVFYGSKGVSFIGTHFENVNFRNNIFYLPSGGAALSGTPAGVTFNYNLYYAPSGTITYGAYSGLAAYQATGAEANGLNNDPLFVAPGSNYRLSIGSPAINSATTIPGRGFNDFYKNNLSGITSFDRGAHEYGITVNKLILGVLKQ